VTFLLFILFVFLPLIQNIICSTLGTWCQVLTESDNFAVWQHCHDSFTNWWITWNKWIRSSLWRNNRINEVLPSTSFAIFPLFANARSQPVSPHNYSHPNCNIRTRKTKGTLTTSKTRHSKNHVLYMQRICPAKLISPSSSYGCTPTISEI